MSKNRNGVLIGLATLGVMLPVFIFLSVQQGQHLVQYAQETVYFQDEFENGLGNWQAAGPGFSITENNSGPNGANVLAVTNPGNNTLTNVTYRSPIPLSGRISVWIYDNGSNTNTYKYMAITNDAVTQGATIGIRPATTSENYAYCPVADQRSCMDTGKKRTVGWHQFKLFVTPKGTYGKIDGDSFSHLPSNIYSPPVNVNFTQFQKVILGVQYANETGLFDGVYIDPFPPPPASDFDLAMGFIDVFLTSYNTLNISSMDTMIKAREDEYCRVDYDLANTNICPHDNSNKPPRWHYKDQLLGFYSGLLNTSGAHVIKYLKSGNISNLSKAKEIIRYIDNEYSNWSREKNSSPLTVYLIINSSLIWDTLEPDLQQSIKSHIAAEADYFNSQFQPYSSYIDNSSGEENSWPGGFLNIVFLAFPDLPNANIYFERSKFFAFHTLTRGETYGGFTSQTLHDNFLFDNHGYHPHPSYGLGTGAGQAGLAYKTQQYLGYTPTEYTHNVNELWQKNKEFIDFRTFRYKGQNISPQDPFYPTGLDDWGTDALSMVHYRIFKEVLNDNTYTDPETGFFTSDLSRHALEYIYYTRYGFLWKPEVPNVLLTEMLLSHGLAHPFPNWQEGQSYKWLRNARSVWDYVAYFYYFDPSIVFRSRATATSTPTLTVPTATPLFSPSNTPIPMLTPSNTPTPTLIPSQSSYRPDYFGVNTFMPNEGLLMFILIAGIIVVVTVGLSR